MSSTTNIRCEHCGAFCKDEWELEVYHRGCRLRAAFPNACTAEGPLLKFDIAKIKEELEQGS